MTERIKIRVQRWRDVHFLLEDEPGVSEMRVRNLESNRPLMPGPNARLIETMEEQFNGRGALRRTPLTHGMDTSED